MTTPPITSDDDTEEITDNVFATPTMIPEHSGKRRRGRKPEDEDPEVKRQRFLERNRYMIGCSFKIAGSVPFHGQPFHGQPRPIINAI